MAVAFEPFDEEKERVRLRKMSDDELIREGEPRVTCVRRLQTSANHRVMFTSLRYDFVRKNIGGVIPNNQLRDLRFGRQSEQVV
jgi:hypothetical protein